ncbi:MAG: acyl carrier protein [Inquilinus sp.]|nr:acyl carrier protein [Inquilinus sp.]
MQNIRDAIHAAWEEAIGVTIDVDQDLFDQGADSMMALNVQLELESNLDVTVPSCRLMREPTVAGWASIFREAKVN